MSIQKKQKINKLVFTAVFSALICVLTMFPKLPVPLANGGYIHMGDALIIVSAFILGPAYATVAAGIGSMLADCFGGYAVYMPATLIIKAIVALVAALIFRALKYRKDRIILLFLVAAASELIMVFGYFLFEWLLYGIGAALVAAAFNLVQAASGIILGVILIKVISKNKSLNKLLLLDGENK